MSLDLDLENIDLDQILAQFSGYGAAYVDLPLGTNPYFFRILSNELRGHLDTFDKDFIPPGYQNPSYVPPNRGQGVMIFGLASLAVAVIVVIIRLATKSLRAAGGRIKRINDSEGLSSGNDKAGGWEGKSDWEWWRPWKKYGLRFGRVGWDDWAMVIALMLLAGYTTLNVLSAIYGGMGKHVYDVSLNSVRYLLRTTFVHSALYLTLAFFIKLSILLFYLNLFPPTFIGMRRTIYGLIAFFFIYTIVGTTVIAMMCKPVKAFWTLELRGTDNCPSQADVERRYSSVLGIHVAGDFLILILPMRMVSQLRLPKRQKIILVCLFGAGGLACIASILRLYYFPRINASLDVTWNVTEISLWGQVEASTAVICASIPALKPLFSSLNKKRKSYRESTSTVNRNILSSSPLQPSFSDGHSRNRSFSGQSLSPSYGNTLRAHSRSASISATSVSSTREKSVKFSPTADMLSPSPRSAVESRDVYDRDLAEIDNIDIDIYLDESAQSVQPKPVYTITPPSRVYMGGEASGLVGHQSVTPTTTGTIHSANTSWTSLNSEVPQHLSVPEKEYLCPPRPRQYRPQLPPLQTKFEQTPPTLALKAPSPRVTTPKAAPPNAGAEQTLTPRSTTSNTSKPLPSLPNETHSYTKYAPSAEPYNYQPRTANTPYNYTYHYSWDTTGVDSTVESRSAPVVMDQRTNVEWGGWGVHDGMNMV